MKLYTGLKGQLVNIRNVMVQFDADGVADTDEVTAKHAVKASPTDFSLTSNTLRVSDRERFEMESARDGQGYRAASVVKKEHVDAKQEEAKTLSKITEDSAVKKETAGKTSASGATPGVSTASESDKGSDTEVTKSEKKRSRKAKISISPQTEGKSEESWD